MRDFNFHNPTRIVFGRGASERSGQYVKEFGTKALLVYGRGSIKSGGLHARILASLAGAGISVVEHGGVKPNPSIFHVREGIARVKNEGVDVVLAVGGGSVMDEAKVIAGGATVEHDPWDFFTGGMRPASALSIVVVPTLAATGSEMNGNAVVSNADEGKKMAVYSPHFHPKTAILDPETTLTVPPRQISYGLVDIFSHIIEPYFNAEETNAPVQDRLAEGLIAALFDIAPRAMKDPGDLGARADMLWASTVALNGILAAGRGRAHWENHLLAHALGALFDAPHGGALAVVVPGWMRHNLKRKGTEFERFARRAMGAVSAHEGVDAVKRWISSVGAPVSLGTLGIRETDIPAIIDNVMASGGGYPHMRETDIREIMRLCL